MQTDSQTLPNKLTLPKLPKNVTFLPQGKSKWRQGLYTLVNPAKYLGDPNRIVFRSSWEQEAFRICDLNPNVLEWGSEILIIPYLIPNFKNPSGRPREKRYIPDLYVVTQESNGTVSRKVIEIKPYKQTLRSKSRNPNTKMYEDYTYAINQLKWQAAQSWCDARGIQFIVTTERELFGK